MLGGATRNWALWSAGYGDRLLRVRDLRIAIVLPGPVLFLYCAGWGCQPRRVRPRIRYCATPAGRVAYSTSGAGPALLFDSGWVSHLRGQLELYSFGDFVGRLAERFTVIRYDNPGCGLSDRDGTDLSFDGQAAAALAVADAVGAGRFRLFGASQGGQVAAAIAARHPERVEALVLYGVCASGRDLAPAEIRDSVVALVRAHWGLGLKALAGAFVTDPTAEDVEAFTRAQRASTPTMEKATAKTQSQPGPVVNHGPYDGVLVTIRLDHERCKIWSCAGESLLGLGAQFEGLV